MFQDRFSKIIKLDHIGFSAIWGYGVSKVRDLCTKLETPTEDKNNVSILDAVTNVMRHPGFDAVKPTKFCDQGSDAFDDFDVVSYES